VSASPCCVSSSCTKCITAMNCGWCTALKWPLLLTPSLCPPTPRVRLTKCTWLSQMLGSQQLISNSRFNLEFCQSRIGWTWHCDRSGNSQVVWGDGVVMLVGLWPRLGYSTARTIVTARPHGSACSVANKERSALFGSSFRSVQNINRCLNNAAVGGVNTPGRYFGANLLCSSFVPC